MKEPERGPWQDFGFGLIIMIIVIILAFWLTRNDSTATQANCDATQTYAQGC